MFSSMFRRLFSAAILFCLGLVSLSSVKLSAQVYVGKPKIIVIVVIDQFRGDYLNRYRDQFKGNGFRLFMDRGAWFTQCYYDYANTKTAPGHATLGTGAYTDGHGIDSNEWWDLNRSRTKKVTSVEDERYQLVDLPQSSLVNKQAGVAGTSVAYVVGASPRNLRASTLGDELRLATNGKARVFGVSLKDRAAILPAGQSANAAYWIDSSSGQFTSSTYYMQHLPGWAASFNAGDRRARAWKDAHAEGPSRFYDLVGHTPAANSYELDFAKALIEGEKLGQNGVTDLITISLSANDIVGHRSGPDSPEMKRMALGLDRDLDEFFLWLDKSVGLQNTWIALSADHGIAPLPEEAAKLGVDSATLNMTKLYERVNTRLRSKFSAAAKTQFLMPGPELPYITLNDEAFRAASVDEKAAEETVALIVAEEVRALQPRHEEGGPSQQRLAPSPQIEGVYTRIDMQHGALPPSEWGRELAHSYTDHGNWFVMLVLGAYQQEGGTAWGGTSHFSPWSYDRHVPLAFYGAPFAPGEYLERVQPVDMAATLAALAGVNQPSAAVGRVLTEALRSDAAHRRDRR